MLLEIEDLQAAIARQDWLAVEEWANEYEQMSREDQLSRIVSHLEILLAYLIKLQAEKKLTAWNNSIRNSLVAITKSNRHLNKRSHYIKADEWQEYLEIAYPKAAEIAAKETLEGKYASYPEQMPINLDELFQTACTLLQVTYVKPLNLLSEITTAISLVKID